MGDGEIYFIWNCQGVELMQYVIDFSTAVYCLPGVIQNILSSFLSVFQWDEKDQYRSILNEFSAGTMDPGHFIGWILLFWVRITILDLILLFCRVVIMLLYWLNSADWYNSCQWLETEQTPWGSGYGIKPSVVQEAFEQHSQ